MHYPRADYRFQRYSEHVHFRQDSTEVFSLASLEVESGPSTISELWSVGRDQSMEWKLKAFKETHNAGKKA